MAADVDVAKCHFLVLFSSLEVLWNLIIDIFLFVIFLVSVVESLPKSYQGERGRDLCALRLGVVIVLQIQNNGCLINCPFVISLFSFQSSCHRTVQGKDSILCTCAMINMLCSIASLFH